MFDGEGLIFVAGFTRGGTTWLRESIGAHEDVSEYKSEVTLLRDYKEPDALQASASNLLAKNLGTSTYLVSKAPANSPFLIRAIENLPKAKIVFIARDPRDVLVSHQRGTSSWMNGANKTSKGVLKKLESYWDGYKSVSKNPNVLLVSYEQLHQTRSETLDGIFKWLKLSTTAADLERIQETSGFFRRTGRKNVEDRSAAKRMGLVGQWGRFLSEGDRKKMSLSQVFNEVSELVGLPKSPWALNDLLSEISVLGSKGSTETDNKLAKTVQLSVGEGVRFRGNIDPGDSKTRFVISVEEGVIFTSTKTHNWDPIIELRSRLLDSDTELIEIFVSRSASGDSENLMAGY